MLANVPGEGARRLLKFSAENLENELASMTAEEIDELAFGVIRLDADGTILACNAAEGEISGRDPEAVIGRNFFRDVAPCTRSDKFEGRFRQGVEQGRLDVQFTYVFDDDMQPTEVRVRMRDAEDGEGYWVVVERV